MNLQISPFSLFNYFFHNCKGKSSGISKSACYLGHPYGIKTKG